MWSAWALPSSLDEIALGGSGNATHFFPATGDVAGQLTAALKQIAGAITCDYAIPSTGKALDFSQVNVAVKVGAGGKPTLVGGVANAMGCTAQGGWYYDESRRLRPKSRCVRSRATPSRRPRAARCKCSSAAQPKDRPSTSLRIL